MVAVGRTVLVVEDDADVREVALAVLETAGFHVLAATSGDEAHRLLVTQPELHVDVLFTDVVMPGQLDGVDLAKAAHRLRPGLCVLYASGFAGRVRADRDAELRGPVLAKPYSAGDLRSAITGLLDQIG